MLMELIKNKKTLLLLVFLFLSTGCVKDREILAFFFDGVPEYNNAGQTTGNTDKLNSNNFSKTQKNVKRASVQKKRIEIKSIHKPFKERKCDKCHDRTKRNFLVVPKDKLCFQCHDKKKFFNKFVHGPVAPGRCSFCHYAHNSKYLYLLRYENEKLCYQCHNPEDIKKIKDHENRADCLKCHDPHTQDNKYFLKPEVKEKFKII